MAPSAEKTTPLLIDGALTTGGGGAFATVNPATEEPLGTAADGDAADMDRAIAAARFAFDESDWARDTGLRVHCLRQLRDALTAEIEILRDITVAEVGAPIALTYGGQLQIPVDDLEFSARTAENYSWTTDLGVAAPLGIATRRTIVREPYGVVGAITPWNFPHQINLAKIGPAMAAGNTVVLKPAPDTPWCAAELGRIVAEKTDIPAGVLNIVTSSDHRVGAQLAGDPRVDLVSFTGSTVTGSAVMTAAAQTVKKVFLELGGKSAFIVLDDADLQTTCAKAAVAVARHAGQGCAFTSRLLVPRDRYEDALAAATAAMARVAREEIFGPVLTVLAHDGDADAVRIANDSPYGLSGTVYGTDPERAGRVASRLRVGTVNVNGGIWYSADIPFGGYKQSGLGREMGLAGFEEYLETKAIATAVDKAVD